MYECQTGRKYRVALSNSMRRANNGSKRFGLKNAAFLEQCRTKSPRPTKIHVLYSQKIAGDCVQTANLKSRREITWQLSRQILSAQFQLIHGRMVLAPWRVLYCVEASAVHSTIFYLMHPLLKKSEMKKQRKLLLLMRNQPPIINRCSVVQELSRRHASSDLIHEPDMLTQRPNIGETIPVRGEELAL